MLGSHASLIALPLLVLTVTGSSTQAGLVGFTLSAAALTAKLPSGALIDRCNRKKAMLGADLARGVAMALFAMATLTQRPPLLLLLAAATIEGALSSLFAPAAVAALRHIVTTEQLPSAVASNQARAAAARLGGPPLGGFLFGVSHSLPFLANAVSYAISFTCIRFMRAPLNSPRKEYPTTSLRDLIAGLPFLWSSPFLRETLALAAVLNFAFSGIFLAVITTSLHHGASGLSTGVIVACAGLGTLFGALLASKAQQILSPRQILLTIIWTAAALIPLMALRPTTVILSTIITACTVLTPIATVVTTASRIHLTPDHLQGRVSSTSGLLTTSAEPLGLLAAGVLLDHLGTATFLVFAALLATLALIATLSNGLRQAPDVTVTGRRPAKHSNCCQQGLIPESNNSRLGRRGDVHE
jgi:MFS family permease